MISIIISTYQPKYCNQLTNNIDKTIGVPYEIILIENNNQMGICAAYNKGIAKAKFDFLCFIHEDVIFLNNNWGLVLGKYFNNIPELGCVGVAGALYKSKAPSAWWDVPKEQWVAHLQQEVSEGIKRYDSYGWNNGEEYKNVAVIDGVFIATKKSNKLLFDERIKGFHCYDLNYSFESKKKGFKNIVTREIFLRHYSSGSLNIDWLKNTHKIHKLYKYLLPVSVSEHSYQIEIERNNLFKFALKSIEFHKFSIAAVYWMKLFIIKPISKMHITLIKLFIK